METKKINNTSNLSSDLDIKNKLFKHVQLQSNEELGHYLAGLIDGDDHISRISIIIAFNYLDLSLAHYLVAKIGHGNIYSIKNKNAIKLVISNFDGIKTILDLINGKLRSENKLNQINRLLNNSKFTHKFDNSIDFKLNLSKDLNNHWLSGFSDADASFQIKIIEKKHRKKPEVRLSFQISQKTVFLLELIKSYLGGNIGHRVNHDTFYYSSTNFKSANNVINYFDKFNLLSSKYLNYLKWKKAYLLIQDRQHLEISGIEKILTLKKSMNSYSKETLDLFIDKDK